VGLGSGLARRSQSGPERRVVRLEKPWFFVVDIVIEPIGGDGPGILPPGLEIEPEKRSKLTTYHFRILLHARFDLLTSGNWQTEEHKRWAELVFAGLREAMSD